MIAHFFLRKKTRWHFTKRERNRRDNEPGAPENYSRDSPTIDVYCRVCIRTLTFGACARHFMYYTGRGGLVCVFRPCLPPRFLFLNAQRGCLWVYYTTDPVRSAAHTRAREEYVHVRRMIWRVCWDRVRCGSDACEILPSRIYQRLSPARAGP